MNSFALSLVAGHVIGDFFLQTRSMAENKYQPGRPGHLWCSIHVAVYTATVALCAHEASAAFLAAVALPHWLVDRFSLAYRWMRLIGRGEMLKSKSPVDAAFGAIVYVTLDQAIHLGCLYMAAYLATAR